MCQDQSGKMFWCSSSSWVFSELPNAPSTKRDVDRLNQINNIFTGEFDNILFESEGPSQVIDPVSGLELKPKPVTELDRLSYVFHQIANNFAVPKGFCKYIPSEKLVQNEAFKGLSKE